IGIDKEKASYVRAFANSIVKTYIATNILRLRLNTPSVRVVIYVVIYFLLR
ncbi:hypothetical protein BDW02DRAFT_511605, partial [Decorospora gaudefroyi]